MIKDWRIYMEEIDDLPEGYFDASVRINDAIYGRVDKEDASVYESLYQAYNQVMELRLFGYPCHIEPKPTRAELDEALQINIEELL